MGTLWFARQVWGTPMVADVRSVRRMSITESSNRPPSPSPVISINPHSRIVAHQFSMVPPMAGGGAMGGLGPGSGPHSTPRPLDSGRGGRWARPPAMPADAPSLSGIASLAGVGWLDQGTLNRPPAVSSQSDGPPRHLRPPKPDSRAHLTRTILTRAGGGGSCDIEHSMIIGGVIGLRALEPPLRTDSL
jgi:hypothetical protein